MKTRMIDGEQHCLVSESGGMTLWELCEAAPLQMSAANPFINVDALASGLVVLACGCIVFRFAGSIAASRRRRYQRLFTSVERGLKQ